MKKALWIAYNAAGEEMGRYTRKAIAVAIAHELGGYISKYTCE